MIVIDSSALVEWLLLTPAGFRVAHRLVGSASTLHAPELLFVETSNALRKMVMRGILAADRAEYALRHMVNMRIHPYPQLPLIPRIWELRNNLSAYDATYIALTEKLNAILITCDARIGGASGHSAQVEII